MVTGLAQAVWHYRGFVMGSVRREFQSRYRNSLLGATWAVLNPLAMIIVYTVIFAQVMRSKLPGSDNTFAYSIYLCAGVLTWGLFAEILSRAQNVFIEHANLIKKISFPRICLPVIVVLNALSNFGIIFGLFTLFLVVSGNFPGWVFFSLIPVLLIQIVFSIGLGMVVGVLNVFFRDVGQFFTVLLQFWFWLTPVVYPSTILPPSVQTYVNWNPMVPLIAAYQNVLVHATWPHWHSLIYPSVLAALLAALAMRLFRRHVGEMVDEL
jgi:lipopolysaccharide transport system permease protein